MIDTRIDIRAEIAKVQGELVLFRDKCLPALFQTPIDGVFEGEYADWVREKTDGRLSEWREATRRLVDLLPLGPLAFSTISREDFEQFLFQDATPSYCVQEGRIGWRIRLFVCRSRWREITGKWRQTPPLGGIGGSGFGLRTEVVPPVAPTVRR